MKITKLGIFLLLVILSTPIFAQSNEASVDNQFIGVWSGSFMTKKIVLTIEDSTWKLNFPDAPDISTAGTYVINGNSATLYRDDERFALVTLSGKKLDFNIYGGFRVKLSKTEVK